MWFFQHKKLIDVCAPYTTVWVSFGVHVFLAIVLFFMYRGSDEHMTVKIDRSLYPAFDITLLRPTLTGKTGRSSSSGQVQKKNMQKNSVQTTAKQAASSPTKSSLIAQPVETKKIETKKQTKSPPKKIPAKKEIQKQEVKKVQEKKNVVPAVAEAVQKVGAVDAQIMPPMQDAMSPVQSSVDSQNTIDKSTIDDDQDAIYVTPQELQELKKIEFLRDELVKVWQPPQLNMVDPECIIEVMIDRQELLND
jgi:outer membrane biosynthesis protein TonB